MSKTNHSTRLLKNLTLIIVSIMIENNKINSIDSITKQKFS